MPITSASFTPRLDVYNFARTVTPSDSVNLEYPCEGIYVGTTGNVALVFLDDSVVTFIGVPAGKILKFRAKRVNLTNTSAGNMLACY